MLKTTIETIKATLQATLSGVDVEIFSRDISQYKYISHSPIGVITLSGSDFSPPPHECISQHKAVLELSFYYFTRSVDDKSIEDLSQFVEAISSLEGVNLDYLRSHSHKKDVSIFEVKAYLNTVLG